MINATGPAPLIISAAEHVQIDGTLDAGSHVGGLVGAGADPTACGTATGGEGDRGRVVVAAPGFPPAAAVAHSRAKRWRRRRGSQRQSGSGGRCGRRARRADHGRRWLRGWPSSGPPSGSSTVAPGGAGGGAVLLTAKTSLGITGNVLAGGAGGQ